MELAHVVCVIKPDLGGECKLAKPTYLQRAAADGFFSPAMVPVAKRMIAGEEELLRRRALAMARALPEEMRVAEDRESVRRRLEEGCWAGGVRRVVRD